MVTVKHPKLIAGGIFSLLMLILIFQNMESVSVEILFWRPSLSGAILYPAIFLVGALVGSLFSFYILQRKSTYTKL